MKRICFLSPDVAHARSVVADLMSAGIPEKHIYALARHDIEMGDLPDAGPESDDFTEAYKRGLELGGSAGILAGLTALAFPPAGIAVGGGFVLLTGLWGAGVGALLTGIAGAAFPSSRLQAFETAIEAGKVLVMADVPRADVSRFEALVKQHDPEVEVEGIEPAAPLIP